MKLNKANTHVSVLLREEKKKIKDKKVKKIIYIKKSDIKQTIAMNTLSPNSFFPNVFTKYGVGIFSRMPAAANSESKYSSNFCTLIANNYPENNILNKIKKRIY